MLSLKYPQCNILGVFLYSVFFSFFYETKLKYKKTGLHAEVPFSGHCLFKFPISLEALRILPHDD